MGSVYHRKLVEGVTIPAIIHNSSYYLINMAVYENGTVSCWHRSDLPRFKSDLKKGWVVPSVPDGQMLSIHGLGCFPVKEAQWLYNADKFYKHVQQVIRSLNPEMANLYKATKREIDKWNQARVEWSATPIPCKLKETLGYTLLDGKDSFLFYRKDGALYLTTITVYADKTIQIAAEGERFFTMEEVDSLFAEESLCTVPNGTEYVTIEGLGRVLLESSPYETLLAEEKQKEVHDMSARMSGEKDTLDRCRDAYHEYLNYPGDFEREALRKAYEAVPEHQRMYLGSMDDRDSDYIRILYHPENKREV